MDPAVLIFLLYLIIAHELVCGWMCYRRQRHKPRKQAVTPVLRSSGWVHQGTGRTRNQGTQATRDKRDLRKSGRIIRKA